RTVGSSSKLPSTRQYTGKAGPGVPGLSVCGSKSLIRHELPRMAPPLYSGVATIRILYCKQLGVKDEGVQFGSLYVFNTCRKSFHSNCDGSLRRAYGPL